MGRYTFAGHDAPLIVDVVREKTVRDAIADMKNAAIDGAKGYDLHLSALDESCRNAASLREILSNVSLPVMALSYSQSYDFSPIRETEEQRVGLLRMAIDAGVDCIDMQNYSFDERAKEPLDPADAPSGTLFAEARPREVTFKAEALEKQRELISYAHEKGCEVLISCHTLVPMKAEQLLSLARHIETKKPDVIKIVGYADTDEAFVEAVRGMLLLRREITSCKVHFHCNGSRGKLTRLLFPMLGAYLIFCSDRFTASSNYMQLDLKTVADAFRTLDWNMF